MSLVIGPQLNERIIYEATKDIFNGQNAKMRDRGAVRALINSNSRTGTVMLRVVNKHGFDTVSQAVLKLLSDKVYESTLIARQRFPDLFEASTSQTAAETQVKAEAATTGQAALKSVDQVRSDDSKDFRNSHETTTAVDAASDKAEGKTASRPVSFQVHLPFATQHLLMEQLQKTLELACYQYGVKELQSTIQERDWDCPEAVELNRWTEILGHKGNLKREGINKPLPELLQSIAQIRHTAVHRVRTDSTRLQGFLADAEDLARALGDVVRTEAISKLRFHTQSVIAALAQKKSSMQRQLDEAQKEIARRRAELDQEEEENLRRMEREDERYCALAGEKLQRALNLIGSFALAREAGDALPNGVDGDGDPLSDDGDLDHAEHFEDCSES
ncbi:hypothetical protein BFJ72_g4541 [Fusarium proliferatum]|uniref:Ubiquinol-cytochrome-c reductase cytochrome c1 n=1 Tax=Gibberella intermedia TaxID=948311 RepID=A0A420TNU3_GIBIN|nr:hypothetical protein BFJ72_g4541 [Fusarium proliferatum]